MDQSLRTFLEEDWAQQVKSGSILGMDSPGLLALNLLEVQEVSPRAVALGDQGLQKLELRRESWPVEVQQLSVVLLHRDFPEVSPVIPVLVERVVEVVLPKEGPQQAVRHPGSQVRYPQEVLLQLVLLESTSSTTREELLLDEGANDTRFGLPDRLVLGNTRNR